MRTRFTIAYTALFTVIAVVFALTFYAFASYQELKKVDDGLHIRGDVVQDQLGKSAVLIDDRVMARLIDNLSDERYFRDVFLTVFDREGNVVAQSANSQGAKLRLRRPFESLEFDGKPITTNGEPLKAAGVDVQGVRGMRLRVLRGREQYLVIVATALNEFYASQRNIRESLLAACGIGLLLTAFVGYVVAGPMTRRLNRVAKLADQIRPADLSARIDFDRRGDEISDMAQNINMMLSRLEASHIRLERFAADASHELKTPLAAIIAENAIIDRSDPAALGENLDRSNRELRHLCDTVDALLLLSSSERPVPYQQVDLCQLLTTAIKQVSGVASDYHVPIELAPCGKEEDFHIEGQPKLLTLMLVSLIRHTIAFSTTGHAVRVAALRRSEQVIAQISADGPPLLFEKFEGIRGKADDHEKVNGHGAVHTLGSADERRGTAVGLSVAGRIVELHHGSIQLERENSTTVLSIVLPAAS